MTKVFLFGIDGAPPELVFGKWLDSLPNIKKLMQSGCYAKMESIIPPITIAAWNAMISGRDASQLGIFGYTFTDKDGKARLVSSKNLKGELMWDILGKEGKRSVALYVPLSFPVKPIKGAMVSDFMTPGIDYECAFPESLKEKIKATGCADIFFDVAVGVASHKGLEVPELLDKTRRMTQAQLVVLKDLLANEKWDFFMSVMIGTDRLQHMLWNHFDKTHRRFIKDSPYRNALKDYYIYLDAELGKILAMLDNDTVVIVASDHGMIKQEGKININNWLMEKGYLKLKEGINQGEKRKFGIELVDMEKSIAYGSGAYHARVFINREKAGKKYAEIRKKIAEELKQITDDGGKKLQTKVFFSDEIYNDTSGTEMPDLTIYFDDLRWASNPDLGQEGLYSWKTAVGADSAGHSRQGCFVISGKGIAKKGKIDDIDIRQVCPTILKILGVKAPDGLKARAIGVW